MTEIVNTLVMVETSAIKPYERNPRRNDATVEKLVELIPKVGFNVPLVLDRQNVIVKGHTRWAAAVKLRMPAIPCVYTDADEDSVRLDRIADNKVQEFSSWNEEMLKSELAALSLPYSFDLASLNFKLEDRSFDTTGAARPASNGGAGAAGNSAEPFITQADIAATVPQPQHEYSPIECPKCGQQMMVRR
jgi:ParB family chromosome partitioning protein